MATLGYYLLLAAFIVCAYAGAISVAGARRRSRPLIESGIGAFYLVTAIMGVASAVIVYSFVVGDYSIRYVQRYSDSVQPMFYKLTWYWGGLDGSIMFWVSLLSAFGSAAVYINRERHRELIPYVVTVISVVQMFFLFLMIVHNNPFQTYLTETPTDGAGLNPLLQNFYMAIHPPTMYLGFVGLTIPYAFGMAALITGYLDDSWLRAVRRWTMIAWLFLSVGLGLGMIWAYEELGWGGYWMWDPVENAGLLPWFTATAFLHSVMVQEKRGMLRVWNVCLVITTFFLTIFGTFMTRSGVVQSVHAFGDDPELARLFTIFMIALVVVSFGFVIYRLPLLRARNELDSWLSREAAFMMNNWILLFSAFFVLFATMFPTLSEAIRGERLTVGPPFFNQWMLPIGLTLLLLTGIGPLLAWRKSTVVNLRDQFLFPVSMGLAAGIAVVALGVRVWASGICFALSAFVVGTVSQEFWRGARVRQRATGTDVFTALVGLVGRNKRRYGGYVVHLGMVLIFFGFAGEGFKQKEEAQLKPGQQVAVGDFVVRHDALSVTDDGQKQMITAHVTVLRDGKTVRRDVSGQVDLPQARGIADDRGGHPSRLRAGRLPGARHLRRRDPDGEPRRGHQPARQLGVDGIRTAGARHRHRAPARRGLRVCHRAGAGQCRHHGADPARGRAVAGRGARAGNGAGHLPQPARTPGRERDHVRLRRLPAVGRVVRHDELPRQGASARARSSSTSRTGRPTTRSSPASCASTAATTC